MGAYLGSILGCRFSFITLNVSCHSLACRVSAEKSADYPMGISLCVVAFTLFPLYLIFV